MKNALKMELTVANSVLQKTLQILDESGMNYTVFKDIAGKGEKGSKSAENVLTVMTCTYIVSVSSPKKIEAFLESATNLLETFGGTYFLSEVTGWDRIAL